MACMSDRRRSAALLVVLSLLVGWVVAVNIGSAQRTSHDQAAAADHDQSRRVVIPVIGNEVVEASFVSSDASSIVVRFPSGLSRIRITRATQFCRAAKGCAATRADLRPGDRILANVPGRSATHIDANGDAEYAQIDTINGNRLTVHNTRHDYEPNPPYTLVVQPDTMIEPTTSGAATVVGQYPSARVGDDYTGWAVSPSGAYTGQATAPGVDSTVYAARIFP